MALLGQVREDTEHGKRQNSKETTPLWATRPGTKVSDTSFGVGFVAEARLAPVLGPYVTRISYPDEGYLQWTRTRPGS